MALKEFNPVNVPASSRDSKPKIGFQKTGLINFNPLAQDLLKLAPGDAIKIFQDDKNKEDWYVAKAAGGFILRELSGGEKKYLGFSCSFIKNKLFESLEHTAPSLNLPISDEKTPIEGIKGGGVFNTYRRAA